MTDTRPTGLLLVASDPMLRNSSHSYCDIRLPIELPIHDIPVPQANSKAWASLLAKAILCAEGSAKRDGPTGGVRYVPILGCADRSTSDRFSAAVVDAIEAKHRGAVLS